MKIFARKSLFAVLGAVLLCLPATAWAVPLDDPEAVVDTTPTAERVLDAPNLSRDVASLGKELLVSIGHDTVVLEPNAPYEVFLDDISLGTYRSDPNGQLFIQIVLPPSTKPGSRLLKVTTDNMQVQKIVTVVQ